MGAWIYMVPVAEATGAVKEMYEKVKTPHGTVDNVMRAHSLRPHTMEGHLVLYRSVLHNPNNKLPLWFLECVATATSLLNRCDYSFTHHWANARKLLGDDARAAGILEALREERPDRAFGGKELALIRYAQKLTRSPGTMERADIEACRNAGADDGEILEVNQVCAYFNYSNRLLNGLGVDTEGDVVGFYA
ncbi:MAG TPA: peroxidase-related enzyme [Stellaceae bacterium]|nr:peroxidase-related enzyme [Stellaceae bacterium]